MDDLPGRYPHNRREKLGRQPPVELNLVLLDVDDHNSKAELLEVVLKLKALIGRQENIELLLHQREELMVFPPVPSHLMRGPHVVTDQDFGDPWVDARVYQDAHESCSIAISLLSSRNVRTCSRGM